MVEIISYIRKVACGTVVTLLSVGAASAESYEQLVEQNSVLKIEDDSLTRLIAQRRVDLSAGGEDGAAIGREIMTLEQRIFDLRIKQNKILEELSQRDGEAAESGNSGMRKEGGDSSVKSLANAEFVKKSIPAADYSQLLESEKSEPLCAKLFSEYSAAYLRLRELKQLYDQSKSESEAIPYSDEFEALNISADSLSQSLAESWGKLYDSKSFAYSMLLEVIGDTSLLDKESQITRDAAAKISTIESCEQSLPALNYEYQKRSQLQLERVIAEKLNLPACVDSLASQSAAIEKREALVDLSEVQFTIRNFIAFAPIRFSSTTPYNKSKPIPTAEEYKRGLLYRIQLGAYNLQQLPTIFRGTYPLCRDRALGFWTYYAGCFATLEEAEAASQLLKRRGFKRPEIVRWQDGVRRNLYREPLPKSKGFRVVISGVTELSEPLQEAINAGRGDAELSKIGGDKYVINVIHDKAQADKLSESIKAINEEIVVKIITIE